MVLVLAGCTANPQESAGGNPAQGNETPAEAANSAPGAQNATDAAGGKAFTMEEVAAHGTKGDCWLVINGNVLNLSGFSTHPGGDAFVPYCGKDATEGFATMGGKGSDHPQSAYAAIGSYVIGRAG